MAESRNTQRTIRRGPFLWILSALIIFAGSTYVAFTQKPRLDPFQEVNALELDYWRYPVERNAFARLQYIPSSLNDVFALPGTDKVWAVGYGGLIIHSDNAGITWQQQFARQSEQQPDQPAQAVLDLPDLIPSAHAQTSQAAPEYDPKVFESKTVEPGVFETKEQTTRRPLPPQASPKTRPVSESPKEASTAQRKPEPEVTQDNERQRKEDISQDEQPETTEEDSSGQGRQANQQGQHEYITAHLFAVHFVDENRGWVVGDNRTILYTTDGGTTWTAKTRSTSARLSAVYFVEDGQGWTVGENGTILTSTNGGKNWTAQQSKVRSDLNSVHFVSSLQGWAVGENGTILHTIDGGTSWTPQPSNTSASLRAVHFVSPSQGWAVGENGTILRTTDGGTPWSPQSSPTDQDLFAVHFSSPTQGWVVGKGSEILRTADGGVSWTATVSKTAWLFAVHFVSPNEGWIVGRGNRILHTTDGGDSWTPQTNNTSPALFAVHSPTSIQGWAVGSAGTILHTADSGASWSTQTSAPSDWLYAVHFVSPTQGWAAGRDGTILHTADGGDSWAQQTTKTAETLRAVHFVSATQGWVVGEKGVILMTTDGGTSWKPRTSNTLATLRAVHFVSATRGWVVGAKGTIRTTTDGGASWAPQASNTSETLDAVHFISLTQGWAVGAKGTIRTTSDGGASWAPQTSNTSAWLYAVHFAQAAPQYGYIVGAGSTILQTRDGGHSWQSVYHRGFAPWYYLVGWGLPLLFVFIAFRSKSPEERQASIADEMASDRPLEAGDPDPLAFQSIAQGISRFVRNTKTTPPLTIAITGEWGTGKSSLMNLLKADLQGHGFRPVWFNAWHHQKEEHLLAALLENIRLQAVPPWWHPRAWRFRARLLIQRSWRNWLPISVLLAFFLFGSGYAIGEFKVQWDKPQTSAYQAAKETVSQLTVAWKKAGAQVQSLTAILNGKPASPPVAPTKTADDLLYSTLTGFICLIGLIIGAIRSLPMFGVKPAALLASVSKNARIRHLKAQTGFRQRFATEFKDVTEALKPRTMLILIDDLDRCRPEQVLEILETVNFLVSSGDCFVIMGMALDRVKRCVGLGFKDVAEEFMDEQPIADQHAAEVVNGGQDLAAAVQIIANRMATAESEEGKKNRAEFAQQYLEKLINIEVPVPVLTAEQAKNIVSPELEDVPLEQQIARFVRRQGTRIKKLIPVALVILSLAGGSWFHASHQKSESQPKASDISQTAPSLGNERGASTGPASEDPEPPKEELQPPDQPARISDPPQAKQVLTWPTSVLVGLLFLSALVLLRSKGFRTNDSPEFANALRIWLPLVSHQKNTPRAVKRFVNRVRYLAMLQAEDDPPTLFQRLVFRKNGIQDHAKTKIPESLLVALGAVHESHEDWIQSDPALKERVDQALNPSQQNGLAQNAASDGTDTASPQKTSEEVFQSVVAEHQTAHETLKTTPAEIGDHVDTFLHISEGIRVADIGKKA